MAEPQIHLKQFLGGDLNLVQAWRDRQDRRDEIEFAAVIEAAGTSGPTGGETAKPKGEGAAEKPKDDLTDYKEKRAAEGPEGGIYDADKLGRSGHPDEGPIQDPIKALMTAFDRLARMSSPDITGSAPGTPGDVKGVLKTIRGIAAALKRGRTAVQAAGGELSVTNLARVDAEEGVKKTIAKMDSLLGQAKKTTTHQETIEGAETVGLTVEEVLTTPDAVWQLEAMRFKQQGLRDLHTGLAAQVKQLHMAAKTGDQAAADELLDAFLLANAVGDKNKLMGTGAGQILEARKIMADPGRAGFTMEEVRQVAERLAIEGASGVEDIARIKAQMLSEGIDGFALAKILDQVPTGQRKSFLGRVWAAYKYTNDALHWLFLNSVLSNPVTHAANVLGTVVATAAHYPERYVAEWVNRAFRHDPAGVQRGETWAMMRVFGKAVTDGWRLLGRAIKTGEQPFSQGGRIETKFDLTSAHFGWDPATPHGKLVDTVGMLAPTRLMMSEDGFYKGFNKTQEIAALALREGLARAQEGESLATTAQRIAKLEKDPTKAMVQAAEAAASLRTLNAPLGPAGQAIMSARNLTPGAFYVMPFIQTPTNSIKWTWHRAPLLSAFSIQNWQDILAGGAARDLAISRMLLGSAIGGAVAYHVVQGNITGGLTVGSNKNLKRDMRELGPREFSIRVGDEFYGYKRTDPVGGYIGTIATGIEIYSQLSHDDPQEFDYQDFAIAAGLAAARVALDTPWLMGLSNVLDAIERPDQEGKKLALGFSRALVPGFVRQGTQTGFQGLIEDYPELRELNSMLDQVKSGIPWMVTGVAPVLHPITGDPIVRPAGWGPDMLSPIFVTQRANLPVLEEIIKHRMNFSEPSRMIFGDPLSELSMDPSRQPDGVRLNDDQYFRLKQLATSEWRDGSGRTLMAAMEALIQSEAYQRASPGPDRGKEHALKDLYRQAYDWARIKVREEYPTVDKQVRDKQRLNIQQNLPDTSPEAVRRNLTDLPAVLLKSLGR